MPLPCWPLPTGQAGRSWGQASVSRARDELLDRGAVKQIRGRPQRCRSAAAWLAILSIIRLRSSAVTQQEVAYSFIALVLGLVNGMGVSDRGLVVVMNVVLLLTMLVVDSKPLRDRSRRRGIRLDGVYTNEAALIAELERQLGGQVAYQEITEIDLTHGRGNRDEELVRSVAPRDAQGDSQRVLLRLCEGLERVEHRHAQPMDRCERQLHSNPRMGAISPS